MADAKITSTYENNKVVVVFNESFLALQRQTTIDLELGQEVFNWKFRMVFEDKPATQPFQLSWEYNVEDVTVKVTFHNWTSSSWIALKKPYPITTKSGIKLYFQIKTEANPSSDTIRKIDLTIWKVL